MENMEIKNKNIFLNLNEGEEIFYIAEKAGKFEFYFFTLPSIFFIIFLFAFISLFIFLTLYKPYNENYFCILFFTVLLIFFILTSYKETVDYFFTDVILTNQRLLILKQGKVTPIEHNQIKYIHSGSGRGPSSTIINLRSKKFHLIYFLKCFKLRDKLKEIYSEYDDTKIIEKEQEQTQNFIIILILLFFVFLVGYFFLHIK